MDANRKKIMEKVRALLAKTVENGCTEAEAMAAMTAARRLMDKHQLSQAELETEAETFAESKFKRRSWGNFQIMDRIAFWVGRYCDVHPYMYKKEGVYKCFGAEQDRVFFEWLLNSLHDFVDRAGVQWLKDQRANGNRHYGWTEQRAFAIGCIDRINERLKTEVEARKRDLKMTDGRALVVVKMALVDAGLKRHLAKQGVRLGSADKKDNSHSSGSGYHAGRAHGDRASFNRPVNGGGRDALHRREIAAPSPLGRGQPRPFLSYHRQAKGFTMANLTGPTAHLIPNIQIHEAQPEPIIGMAATVCFHSDRMAATVTFVDEDGKRITVQEDRTRADPDKNPEMGHQDWVHERNPSGREFRFRWNQRAEQWQHVTLTDQNRWVRVSGGAGLILGRRDHYFDWSF